MHRTLVGQVVPKSDIAIPLNRNGGSEVLFDVAVYVGRAKRNSHRPLIYETTIESRGGILSNDVSRLHRVEQLAIKFNFGCLRDIAYHFNMPRVGMGFGIGHVQPFPRAYTDFAACEVDQSVVNYATTTYQPRSGQRASSNLEAARAQFDFSPLLIGPNRWMFPVPIKVPRCSMVV